MQIDHTKWRKGPPPFVGWWNASTKRDDSLWRWWDGAHWSFHASDAISPRAAGQIASRMSTFSALKDLLEWRTYWPENARVPRVCPWIEWHGDGGNPAGEFLVEVVWLDGSTSPIKPASHWSWGHIRNCGDIIRYRVIGLGDGR